MNNENTGDVNCCPVDYFNFKKSFIPIDIREDIPFLIKNDDFVIIGGGGLLNYHPDWNRRINQVLATECKVVFWGVGENTHYDDTRQKQAINYHSNCILGFRDSNKENYLPCVSCMSNNFDILNNKHDDTHKIGAVCHLENDFTHFLKEHNIPYITNNASFLDILQFISDHDMIISNTYHGTYWSQLLAKRIVVINSFSTRFNNFPLYCPSTKELDLTKICNMFYKSKTDHNLLEKCRQLNLDFFNKIKLFVEN